MEKKKHLVTFATKDFLHSAFLLRRSALLVGFDKVYIFTEKDISKFVNENSDIFKYKRGYGLWSWKPYILLEIMNKIPENDLIFYCDAGIKLNINFLPIFNAVETHKRIYFSVGEHKLKDYSIKKWTKFKVQKEFNIENNSAFLNLPQVMGGFHGHINNKINREFINIWKTYCVREELMNDTLDPLLDINVKESRHDQSILTILVYLNKFQIAEDISQFGKTDTTNDNFIQFINIHRTKITLPSIGILTPTIGTPYLEHNIISVQNQTYVNIKHYIVIDGREYYDKVMKIVNKYIDKMPIIVYVLEENTGHSGWNGHRIYGAYPYLMNTDFITYLDEDNTLQPEFTSTMVKSICENPKNIKDYVYCFRNIMNKKREIIGKDLCESLGHNKNFLNQNFIDTNCYLLRRHIAIEISKFWYENGPQYIQDRIVFNELFKNYNNYNIVPLYLTNYMIGNTSRSPKIEFFNESNLKLLNKVYLKVGIYLFHFNKKATDLFFENKNNLSSYAFKDWQITMPSILMNFSELKNGYEHIDNIPSGSVILINLCLPKDIPDVINREDIYKIVYTLEGPNIRHTSQWNEQFLYSKFDVVLTYWDYLLEKFPKKSLYCPFIHRLSLNNWKEYNFLKENDNFDKSIIMILEKRNFGKSYTLNGVKLESLDYLREIYVDKLDNIVAYGESWLDYKNKNKVFVTPNRFIDKPSIEYIQNFTFNLIIENTNAKGYVSEKIYDAWVVGTIPIYINKGNISENINLQNDCYIDEGNMTPGELNNYINNMKIDEIKEYKKNIIEKRQKIIKEYGPIRYSEIVVKAMKKIGLQV